ncbi:MAG: hypothetical protein L0Z62_21955 [Gemmataceae bacterium]|nr:hypothetical protein [Gemmataceae bacterium]
MLKEFGFLRATIQRSWRPLPVATSCAAHIFSDELHLYDIAMADPRHPISKRARKSTLREHRAFGLLPDVMANLFAAARERGCRLITLTAGERPLGDVFSRYGFAVEDSDLARQGMDHGIGIPMEVVV